MNMPCFTDAVNFQHHHSNNSDNPKKMAIWNLQLHLLILQHGQVSVKSVGSTILCMIHQCRYSNYTIMIQDNLCWSYIETTCCAQIQCNNFFYLSWDLHHVNNSSSTIYFLSKFTGHHDLCIFVIIVKFCVDTWIIIAFMN